MFWQYDHTIATQPERQGSFAQFQLDATLYYGKAALRSFGSTQHCTMATTATDSKACTLLHAHVPCCHCTRRLHLHHLLDYVEIDDRDRLVFDRGEHAKTCCQCSRDVTQLTAAGANPTLLSWSLRQTAIPANMDQIQKATRRAANDMFHPTATRNTEHANPKSTSTPAATRTNVHGKRPCAAVTVNMSAAKMARTAADNSCEASADVRTVFLSQVCFGVLFCACLAVLCCAALKVLAIKLTGLGHFLEVCMFSCSVHHLLPFLPSIYYVFTPRAFTCERVWCVWCVCVCVCWNWPCASVPSMHFECVVCTALGLQAATMQPGDRVAIVMTPSYSCQTMSLCRGMFYRPYHVEYI